MRIVPYVLIGVLCLISYAPRHSFAQEGVAASAVPYTPAQHALVKQAWDECDNATDTSSNGNLPADKLAEIKRLCFVGKIIDARNKGLLPQQKSYSASPPSPP